MTPPKPRRYRKFTIRDAAARKLRGASYADLEALYGVPHSTIHAQLKGVFALLDPDRLQAYEANRVNVLTAVELDMLNLLADPERQAKASLNNVAYTYRQLHDTRRLESGLSTSNLAIHELVERVEADQRRRRGVLTPITPPNGNDAGNGAPK